MTELAVVEPPNPSGMGNSGYRADNSESKSDVSVLMRGSRPEISADVDAADLVKLQEMLAKYADILKLVS